MSVNLLLQRLLGVINRGRLARQRVGEADAAKSTMANSATLDFPGQLAYSRLERHFDVEVGHLRQETQQLRAEVTQLVLEVRQLKTVHNASPAYTEAVTLAQQGVSIADIADRCGISLGEAELVAALAQSAAKNGFNEQEGT